MQDGTTVLVTVRDWFYGKDGQNYKAVWGEASKFQGSDMFTLASTPSAENSKEGWFLRVGTGPDAIYIEKSQIQTIQLCADAPLGQSVLNIG